MTEAVIAGDPPVKVLLRESARARRLSLRVSRLDGRVTLTVPRGVRKSEALAFASEKADWIRRAVSERAAPVLVGPGTEIEIEGRSHRVETGPGRVARSGDGVLRLPEARPGKAALAWLKARARERLWERSEAHAAALGRGVAAITLRDPRSRWGSCSAEGRLMYSWRLILAPPEALDYVAAHEVAHLVEMNHAPAFWRVVDRLCPGWETQRDWLRRHGGALHRYRFDD